MSFLIRFSFACILLTLISCKKEEGTGGSSTISGTVEETSVSEVSGAEIENYSAKGKRVFIVYGDDEIQSDDTRTNYDGKFEFPFLNKGDYKIYVFSDCSCPGGEEAVFKTITITGKNQTVYTEDISIVKFVD
jgi:hypothetical protein